ALEAEADVVRVDAVLLHVLAQRLVAFRLVVGCVLEHLRARVLHEIENAHDEPPCAGMALAAHCRASRPTALPNNGDFESRTEDGGWRTEDRGGRRRTKSEGGTVQDRVRTMKRRMYSPSGLRPPSCSTFLPPASAPRPLQP